MKIDLKKLRHSHQSGWLALDLLMLNIIIINLIWVLFDALFSSEIIRQGLYYVAPDFTRFYAQDIHPNFSFYDLCFVGVYLIELGFRWVVAIINKTYQPLVLYPFVHWYDTLGCIPVGSFRWLRLLRVIAIASRLQKIGVIDVRQTYIFTVVQKYLNILIEELSDRIVLHVLTGVQDQIQEGTPVAGKIAEEVLMPRKSELAQWLAQRLSGVTDNLYEEKRDELHAYIKGLIAETLIRDRRMAMIDKIPVLGDALLEAVDNSVSELVFHLLDQVSDDLTQTLNEEALAQVCEDAQEKIIQPSEAVNQVGRQLLVESIGVIKEEVSKKKWKEEYEQELELLGPRQD